MPSAAELAQYGISISEIVGELPPQNGARAAPRHTPPAGGGGTMGVTELEQRRDLAELQRQETELTPRGPLTAPTGAETAAAAGALGLLAAAAHAQT